VRPKGAQLPSCGLWGIYFSSLRIRYSPYGGSDSWQPGHTTELKEGGSLASPSGDWFRGRNLVYKTSRVARRWQDLKNLVAG